MPLTRDIFVVDGARGSHLDPSIQLQVTKGALAPLTAKWGVDATIPEGSDLGEYEAIEYPFAEGIRAAPATATRTPQALAEEIAELLATPRHFYEVLRHFEQVDQRTVVRAWSLLRQSDRLGREETSGKYVLKHVS